MNLVNLKLAPAAVLLALLSACGGTQHDASTAAPQALKRQGGIELAATTVTQTMTPAQASRLLGLATFGPSGVSINELTASGPSAWFANQFQLQQTLHRFDLKAVQTLMGGTTPTQSQVWESFWKQAATGNDQLRQRMAYALSQIFVVSAVDNNVGSHPYGLASFYDTLGQYAFGNYRDLLQAVALHPMMGIYLSHMRNEKESGTRVPDENFAREVMQLMSIGLYELNQDGSPKLDASGKPIETYTHDDVAGLAKVFTGWSWGGPDKTNERFLGWVADPSRDWLPMQNYPAYHSTSEKHFLGVTISGATSGESDLKVALDRLFNHPNVGPFIGRQLIQRLVSSNPSPAYVGRVAAAFADNGAGVRGDMKAVIRAVLLDPEASTAGVKLREPVLRLANWMRAFYVKSDSGRFMMTQLDDPLDGLGQNPQRAPSVFNFYRPTYTPPNTTLATAGLEAPEMQITAEPSVTGYLNLMQSAVQYGIGPNHDIKPDYTIELALAATPEQLMDRVNLLLMAGTMSSTLRSQILGAINTLTLPAPTNTNAAQIIGIKQNRVYTAIFLTMASPEYLVQ